MRMKKKPVPVMIKPPGGSDTQPKPKRRAAILDNIPRPKLVHASDQREAGPKQEAAAGKGQLSQMDHGESGSKPKVATILPQMPQLKKMGQGHAPKNSGANLKLAGKQKQIKALPSLQAMDQCILEARAAEIQFLQRKCLDLEADVRDARRSNKGQGLEGAHKKELEQMKGAFKAAQEDVEMSEQINKNLVVQLDTLQAKNEKLAKEKGAILKRLKEVEEAKQTSDSRLVLRELELEKALQHIHSMEQNEYLKDAQIHQLQMELEQLKEAPLGSGMAQAMREVEEEMEEEQLEADPQSYELTCEECEFLELE